MDEPARDPTDASTSSEETEDSRHSSEEDEPLEYENKRLRREVERLKDKICDLQRSLRRQQRSKETAPGTLCMITYLDFGEDDIQKVEDVLLQCRTKAEGSRRYGAPRYAPRAAIEVQYIKFIDPEHGPQLLRIGGQEYAADVEAPSFMEVPIYHRASDTPLDNAPPKEKDNGESKCFNCGQPGHSVAECPEPRDQAAIQRNRREFLDSTPVRFTGRYATSQKVLLDKFKPGELSEELKQALGMVDGEEPPYYSSMRAYGYPPGYIGRKRTPLARKQEVAVPELIYLDRADEQIDCRNDDEQDEEGEIVQLVQYPGLGLSLDPLLVERKFPTRRPHKRKRESSEESMETDMDMSDDDSSVPQPAPQQQQQQYAYSAAYGYPYGYDYSMSPYAYTPQTASVASSPYPPQAPPTIAATSKPPQPALPPAPAPAPQFTSPVAASQPSDAATPLSPPGSPSADLFGSLPPVEPPVPVAQDAQALQAKQERLLARWRTMVQNRVPATGAAAAPGGQQFQKAMSHPGWSQQGQ